MKYKGEIKNIVIEEIQRKIDETKQRICHINEKGMATSCEDQFLVYLEKLLSFVKKIKEEPVTNLEEAAQKAYPGNIHKQSIFIHGANWKKQHMMKDAVECKVECDVHFGMIVPKEAVKEAVNNSSVLYPGEKVKLIIIKEE